MKFFTHEIKVGESIVPLRAYIPDGAPHGFFKGNRPAVVVFPGGGYSFTYGGEAEPIALAFVAAGFCAFVLDYSVYPARFPQALLEGLTSVRFVRENAEKYEIDPNRISVCGFSAGGHLAACTGTLWNHDCLNGLLEGDRTLYRPNTLILSYPVINPLHRGSFLNLFSKNESELTNEVIDLLSLERQVSSDTPPTFLWHTSDDTCVPVESSLAFAMALAKNKIPFEMRIWENGGHGCCLGTYVTKEAHRIEAPMDCHTWVEDSIRFLLRH